MGGATRIVLSVSQGIESMIAGGGDERVKGFIS